jgi:hypothetical protein
MVISFIFGFLRIERVDIIVAILLVLLVSVAVMIREREQ